MSSLLNCSPSIYSSSQNSSSWTLMAERIELYQRNVLAVILKFYIHRQMNPQYILSIYISLLNEMKLSFKRLIGFVLLVATFAFLGWMYGWGGSSIDVMNFDSSIVESIRLTNSTDIAVIDESQDIQSVIDSVNSFQHSGNSVRHVFPFIGFPIGGTSLYTFHVYFKTGEEFVFCFGLNKGDQDPLNTEVSYWIQSPPPRSNGSPIPIHAEAQWYRFTDYLGNHSSTNELNNDGLILHLEKDDIMRTLFSQEAVWDIGRHNIRQEGREEGVEAGIAALVSELQNYVNDPAAVAKSLMNRFGLSEESAMKKVQQYWKN